MKIKLLIILIAIFFPLTCSADYKLQEFSKDISINQIKALLSTTFKKEYSYLTDTEIKENNKTENPRLIST